MNIVQRRRGRAAVVLAAATLAAAGCALPPGQSPVVAQCGPVATAHPAGPALVGQPYGAAMTPIPLNSVQFGGADLANAMAVQNLYATRTATGTVQLNARFVSCLDVPASVLVRTSFMRTDTSPAEAPTPWKLVHLPPRATALYSELSASSDATVFLVEVGK